MTTRSYQWALLTDWHSGAGPNQHLEAGSVIDGQADRYGDLVSASCRGAPVPLPLPLEASPQTQDAADMMAQWHGPEAFHLIRPGPGVVLRQPPENPDVVEAKAAFNAKREELHQRRPTKRA
jgi:hypothetical protein